MRRASTQLRFGSADFEALHAHLFREDGEEHGAVIAARVVATRGELRLLVRNIFLAEDGSEFVLGRRGYALTPLFVAKTADFCHDNECVWLSVHNHGAGDRVAFSKTDRASHERLYPALLDLVKNPVGALVLAEHALAGELWMTDGTRRDIDETVIVGERFAQIYAKPPARPEQAAEVWARQALLLGARGQALLRGLKVAVVGAGGAGSLVLEQLNHIGVGEPVAIDPDRIDVSNLSRIPGSTRLDALAWLAASDRPWLRRIARRLARAKVRVARRLARRANPKGEFRAVVGDIRNAETLAELFDCDFIFLATDTMTSRLLFNILVHQFLIPGIQLGSKIPVDAGGTIGPIHIAVRPVTPDAGCLSCSGAISQRLLHQEALLEEDLRRQRYLEDDAVEEPSVISFNAIAASHAVTDFLLFVTDLLDPGVAFGHQMFEPRSRTFGDVGLRKDPLCPYCGRHSSSAYAAGQVLPMPTLRSR
jgi:molybdopterin/thiamine biosynthesis adenylyltransferase